MNNPEPVQQVPHVTSVARGLIRWGVKQTVFVLIVALALFASAGSYAGASPWTYLILVALIQVVTALLLIPRRPDLLIERSQFGKGVKAWDIALALFMGYGPALLALAAGLERRAGAPPAPLSLVAVLAVIVAILGTLFTLWAMTSNPFFSGLVRIQQDRGHTVADTGPYAYVRHPGYVGMLIFTLAAPFILGSGWAGVVAVLILVLTVVRTTLEDRTLQQELPGYAAYAQRVRYRLLPGVW